MYFLFKNVLFFFIIMPLSAIAGERVYTRTDLLAVATPKEFVPYSLGFKKCVYKNSIKYKPEVYVFTCELKDQGGVNFGTFDFSLAQKIILKSPELVLGFFTSIDGTQLLINDSEAKTFVDSVVGKACENYKEHQSTHHPLDTEDRCGNPMSENKWERQGYPKCISRVREERIAREKLISENCGKFRSQVMEAFWGARKAEVVSKQPSNQ